MKRVNNKIVSLFFTILFVIIGFVLFEHHKDSAVFEAEKRIEIFMKKWHALFYYVEIRQKEVLYDLEKRGVLTEKGYFNPEVLSFTYIARQIQHEYERLEKEKGHVPYIYRIAASTPRNPINQATQHEEKILNRFRRDEIKRFTEFTYKDDVKYFTSYTPIDRTTETCMRCHSTPDKAPAGLVSLYGTERGFGESTGKIRGMVVMEIPFDEIEDEAMTNFQLVLFVIFMIFVLFYIIITKMIEKDKKLEKLSKTDKLTNLSNRMHFDETIKYQWKLMRRMQRPISLIICDIDYFKHYNDNFGHVEGDRCLQLVAKALQDTIKRESDFVARYGGEEFVILLPDTTYDGAKDIAQKLLESVRLLELKHIRPDNKTIVTMSFGVYTTIPDENFTIDDFTKKADEQLYKAKESGRDCVM
jgi:diguanylate cyclase (GGDEF)-like protein